MIKIILVALTVFLLVWCFNIEPSMLTVREYRIKDSELAGLKIVYAADFHIGRKHTARLVKIVDLINAQGADLVLLGGDFVKGHKEKSTLPIEIIAHELSHINSDYPVCTVLGNHDMWVGGAKIQKVLEKNGIKVLRNSNVSVTVGDKKIYIAGVEDMTTGYPDLAKAFAEVQKPVILLSHQPDIFPKAWEEANIILAGHTHGGQVVLPGYGALLVPSAYGQKFRAGYIEEDNKKMIVTKGLGTSILPVRFNCKPEINVIVFSK